jgi:hypothetical protein
MDISNTVSWIVCVIGALWYGVLLYYTEALEAAMEGTWRYYARGGTMYCGHVLLIVPCWLLATALVTPSSCTVVERAAVFLIWIMEITILASFYLWSFSTIWMWSLVAYVLAFHLWAVRPVDAHNDAQSYTLAVAFGVCGLCTIVFVVLSLYHAVL